jgi:hypothetical protein
VRKKDFKLSTVGAAKVHMVDNSVLFMRMTVVGDIVPYCLVEAD